MRVSLPLLAALAALALPAHAVPLTIGPGESGLAFYGLATQGSSDDRQEWLVAGSAICPQVVSRVRVTLVVVAASPGDELLLHVPGAAAALARPGAPATVEAVQGDPCAEFTVSGVRVAHGAVYRVETASAVA